MPTEGGITNHFQPRVDLRTVIHDLQPFPIQGGALVQTQPFGIHIGKQAAEGAADKRFQRQFFQLCQSRISIAKDPVHCPALLIKDHFDVRKCKGCGLEAVVIGPVFLLSRGGIVLSETADETFLSRPELSNDLLFLPECINQGLAVVEINMVGNVVDGSDGHQTAPVDFEKIVPPNASSRPLIFIRVLYIFPPDIWISAFLSFIRTYRIVPTFSTNCVLSDMIVMYFPSRTVITSFSRCTERFSFIS